jgi:hypothetical protein
MRAADECHPLPDQLHPCSTVFSVLFSIRLATIQGAEKIDAFSRRLRSLPREVLFLRVRIIRSHGLVPLRFSRFVVLFFCRLHVFAWLSVYEKSHQDRSLRAPVKGDANIAIRNEFHRCAPELSSVSPQCRLSRRSKKRTRCFRLPQFPTAFLVSFPNQGADIELATTSCSSRPRVLRSALRRSRRFAFRFPRSFLLGKEHQPSIIDFCN